MAFTKLQNLKPSRIKPFSSKGRSILGLVGCVLGLGLILLTLMPLTAWGQEPDNNPLDVILLIDNSESMSQNDPHALRIRAATYLVDYLRIDAERVKANHRVGTASFGGVVSDSTSLRLLKDETVHETIRAEMIPKTDFLPPLQFARDELRRESFNTGNEMIIILFTDGRPDLGNAEALDAYFDEKIGPLVKELQKKGVSLFVLGIGDAREDQAQWKSLIPQNHYIPITNATELADVYRRIVIDLIGLSGAKGESLPGSRDISIDVEPYLESIVFSFMKPDTSNPITLTTPTGAVISPTAGGESAYHTIYSVPSPEAGTWEAVWMGDGNAHYWVDRQFSSIQLEPLVPPASLGQPITITARLVRSDEVIVDPALRLEATINLPDGRVTTQPLSPIGRGQYIGQFDSVSRGGIYTITARAFLDDQPLQTHSLPTVLDASALTMSVTPSPQPTSTPRVTPEPSPTPLASTTTAQPTLIDTVLHTIGRYGGWIVVLVGILAWFLNNWRKLKDLPLQKEAWVNRIAEAPDFEAALRAFQEGIENEKARLQPLEREVTQTVYEGAIALYERHTSREEPIEAVFFRGIARVSGDENQAVRQGTAEALTDVLFREGEKDVLEHILFIAKHASRVVRRTSPHKRDQVARRISNTLQQASIHGRLQASKANKAGQESEFALYNLISSLLELYADFWLWRGTYAADVRELLQRAEDLLDNPLLNKATFRNELYALYHLLYDVLGEINFAENTKPLPLSVPPGETDQVEKALQVVLGRYNARDGVIAVLKHIANQPFYPLKPFLRQLHKAEQELEKQLRLENLLVPDEVILHFLLQKWRSAAEADQKHRAAALSSLDLVNEQAYIPDEKSEITLRVALHNVSDRARIGKAEHVGVTVEPPLTSYTLYPPLGAVPLILPWETDVMYDLAVTFPNGLGPGKHAIPLTVVFSDLAEGTRSLSRTVEIELLEQNSDLDGIIYDPLALLEIERMAGEHNDLRQLIKAAVNNAYSEPRILFIEDVQGIIDDIIASEQLGEALGWQELSAQERAALLELKNLLTTEGRAHMKMLDICNELSDKFPDKLVNWSVILRKLVRKGYLREKNGLYCFNVELLRAWIAQHQDHIDIDSF